MHIDILFIQPPVMKRVEKEHPVIDEYFKTINKVSNYLGDSPFEPNLGLLSIAGVVREKFGSDVNIHVLDLNIIERKLRNEGKMITLLEIKRELEKFPDVEIIGLSFMTSTYGIWGIDLINLCRETYPSVYIFLGGIHPTIRYREIYKECGKEKIDGIVVGEGELVFCDIIEHVRTGTFKTYLNKHPHIYSGESEKVEKAHLSSKELSALPVPAYDLLRPKTDDIVVRIYTTRGCLKNCSFCSASKFYKTGEFPSPPQGYNIDRVVENLNSIKRKIRIKHLVIGDLSFLNANMQYKELLDKLKSVDSNNRLNCWCQTRADLINAENVKLLKSAGFTQIAIGCEGATNAQLKTVVKGEDVKSIEKALKLIHHNKIEIQGYWIIGLPGDTKESIEETQNKILSYIENGYNTIPHITVLVPYPGSPIGKKPIGIKIHEDKTWKDYWMNCDPFGCGIPVYDTIDENGKTLLTSEEIYNLWLDTLQKVTDKLKLKYKKTKQ